MRRIPTVAASEASADAIARWLAAGKTVILPTETVYGLAIHPGSSTQRVYELKGRPSELNLPVVIGDVDQLAHLGVDFNAAAQALARTFWPGPLTLVMGFRSDQSRPLWLEGRDEVAIRFPDFALLRRVAAAGGPFLLTSANAHGTGAKNVAAEAAESLLGDVDYIVDGGTLSPTPSTIINVRVAPARIERMGAVSKDDLEEFIRNGTVAAQ